MGDRAGPGGQSAQPACSGAEGPIGKAASKTSSCDN